MTTPSTPPAFPRHVVTAVLVAHNGSRWLPAALSGLLGQDRPVQRALAVDTGSEDDTTTVLAGALGAANVLSGARRLGFGAAVDQAVHAVPPIRPDQLPYQLSGGYDPDSGAWTPSPEQLGYAAEEPDEAPYDPDNPHAALADDRQDRAPRTVPLHPGVQTVEWLWLLHDDCEPEPDALRQLLRVAENGDGYGAPTDRIAVLGPKLRSWYDRRQLLEVGATVATSGRRWTGLERREQDQGQHDGVRPVLSVSSAGMLVRRDVWESLGGFDRVLRLMRDDLDFGWRVNSAGLQVLVAPDAVVRHAEAASRERRRIHTAHGGPHQVDKAGAAYALLANTPASRLPWTLLRLVLGTVLRTLGYLVAKVPGQAVDEVLGLSSVLLRPYRILAGRRRRARTRRVPHKELRPLFPKAGATALLTAEQLVGDIARRAEPASSSARHSAVESGPTSDDADFLDEGEKFVRLKRLARRPGPLLLAGLFLLALLSFRGLYGSGALQGGGLLPAPDGASGLWARFTEYWHPIGSGAAGAAPPWLAVPAFAGSLLFGHVGLAVDLMMLLAVPLGGFAAYLAARPLAPSRLPRVWLGAGYAVAPAITAGIAGGRLGMAVLAVLLPLIARSLVSAVGWTALGFRGTAADPAARHTGSWRSAWLAGLLLAVATAFTPIAWPIAAVLLAAAVAWVLATDRRNLAGTDAEAGQRRTMPLRALAVLVVPLVLDAPWSLQLFTSPSRFLGQAGLPDLSPARHDLLGPLFSPGGDGVLPGLVYGGVLLAALAALLATGPGGRLRTVLSCWAVAVVGAVFGLWAQHSTADGATAWNGALVLVCTSALLAAAAVGADGAKERVSGSVFGWRQPVALAVAGLAVLGPVVALGWWAIHGAGGPLASRAAAQVPPFVAEESSTSDQARTLVLRTGGRNGVTGSLDYAMVRGSGIRLGDGELLASGGSSPRLDEAVRDLAAGTGGNEPQTLASFAVRYIVARPPVDKDTARVLDTTPGLTRLSQEDGTALWRNDAPAARLMLARSNGLDATPVPSTATSSRAHLPAGPDGRVLRLADRADANWSATLDGKPLQPVTLDGWAQGFKVPSGGGALSLDYNTPLTHTLWLWAQGLLVLVAVVLALPGRRLVEEPEEQPDEEPAVPQGAPGGRRARRLAAQAAAEAASRGEAAPDGAATGAPVPPAPAAVPADPQPGGAQGWFPQGDPYGYDPAAAAPQPGAGEYPYPGAEPGAEPGYPAPVADPAAGAYAPGYPEQPAAWGAPQGDPGIPLTGGQDPSYGAGLPVQDPGSYADPAGYAGGAPYDPAAPYPAPYPYPAPFPQQPAGYPDPAAGYPAPQDPAAGPHPGVAPDGQDPAGGAEFAAPPFPQQAAPEDDPAAAPHHPWSDR